MRGLKTAPAEPPHTPSAARLLGVAATGMVLLASCDRPEDPADATVGTPVDRSTVEVHRVETASPHGAYAVVRLPIDGGMPIWNPSKLALGPDGVMYGANHTGELFRLIDRDGDGLEDTAELFADVRNDGLRAPAALAFRGSDLYVGVAQGVWVYADTDGDGAADERRMFFDQVPYSEHPYEWTSALTFGEDGSLYAVLTTDSWNAGASPDPTGLRGSLLRIAPDGSSFEQVATGLRSVHGMVMNEAGDLFLADNEGGGNPVEELNLAVQGAFYGHNPAKYGSPPVTEALHAFRTDVAPAGMAFNDDGNDFDGTAGDLFVAFYGPGERWNRGSIGRLRITRLDDAGYAVEEHAVISNLPKLSDVAFGADGSLYAAHVGHTDYWYQALDEPDGGIYRIFEASWVEPVPPQQRATDHLVASADAIEVGRQLFVDLACSACHAVDGKTELLGPNLKDVGRAFSRAELLEEIEDPGRRIKPSMAPTRLTKTDGSVLLGRVVSSTEAEIRIMVVGNSIVTVPRSEVAFEEAVTESMMWTGLLGGLSQDQIDALLDYLISLGQINERGI